MALVLLNACRFSGEKSVPDFGEKVNEDHSNQKAKRISQADLLAKASEIGGEVAAESQTALISSLMKAIEERGLVEAVSFCNTIGIDTVKSIGNKVKAEARRTALKWRNPLNEPTDIERQVLEAYSYNKEQNLPLEDNVQLIENGTKILFTRPILLAAPLCLNCHGNKESLDAPLLAAIEKLYPNDQATGFALNDFRGMWSISLLKSEVIKRMD